MVPIHLAPAGRYRRSQGQALWPVVVGIPPPFSTRHVDLRKTTKQLMAERRVPVPTKKAQPARPLLGNADLLRPFVSVVKRGQLLSSNANGFDRVRARRANRCATRAPHRPTLMRPAPEARAVTVDWALRLRCRRGRKAFVGLLTNEGAIR